MADPHRSLVIAGGGLVGLTAAILFADRFQEIIVLEKRSDPRVRPEGKEARSLQLVLSARGWTSLRLLGFEQEIRSVTLDLKGRWHHKSDSHQHFEPYSPDGRCISCISRESLYRMLCEKAGHHQNICLSFDSEAVDFDLPKKLVFVQKSGKDFLKKHSYDFLLGCDGVRSRLAAHLNPDGEDFQKEENVYREISVSDVPWERDAFHYWHTDKAMIGAFPVFEGGFSLFLVHREADYSDLLLNQDSTLFASLFPEISSQIPGLKQEFAEARGGILGSKSCGIWHSGDSVALAGDAAHAVLPFMGQGLNTGLEDLWVLNDYLESTGLKSGHRLADYEAVRRPQAEAIRKISHDQFRYLTGKYSADEYKQRSEIASSMLENGLLPTYSACAFSLESFAEILAREEMVRAGLLA